MNTVFNKRLKTTVAVKTGTYVGEPEKTDIVTWEFESLRFELRPDFAGMVIKSIYLDSEGKKLERKDKGVTTLNSLDEISAMESMISLSTEGSITPKLKADVLSATKLLMAQTFGINPVTQIVEETWNEINEVWE